MDLLPLCTAQSISWDPVSSSSPKNCSSAFLNFVLATPNKIVAPAFVTSDVDMSHHHVIVSNAQGQISLMYSGGGGCFSWSVHFHAGWLVGC